MIQSSWLFRLIAGVLLVWTGTVLGQDAPAIHVYGPGGPAPAMLECARTFNARNGSNVIVTFGPTGRWKEAAARDADMAVAQ